MSPTQHYFSNAVGSVDFAQAGGYIYLHWSGASLTSPEFRALYIHAHNLLRRHELTGILADHQAMPAAPDPADRDWLLQEWLPAVLEDTNFVRYAVLPTLEPEHRLHTPAMAKQLRRVVTTAFFDDLDEAANWLRQPTLTK
ncbi:MAG: hypothetical protein M3Y54_13455 [Bacteroidota bacterium]|nr:hypothetical protein [Bacteroidota bacterium]